MITDYVYHRIAFIFTEKKKRSATIPGGRERGGAGRVRAFKKGRWEGISSAPRRPPRPPVGAARSSSPTHATPERHSLPPPSHRWKGEPQRPRTPRAAAPAPAARPLGCPLTRRRRPERIVRRRRISRRPEALLRARLLSRPHEVYGRTGEGRPPFAAALLFLPPLSLLALSPPPLPSPRCYLAAAGSLISTLNDGGRRSPAASVYTAAAVAAQEKFRRRLPGAGVGLEPRTCSPEGALWPPFRTGDSNMRPSFMIYTRNTSFG
ncbi:Protein of unknown function [Gryllus bimaculatus]|nr:Protein of unknown function [Gryllus bimaculatus]